MLIKLLKATLLIVTFQAYSQKNVTMSSSYNQNREVYELRVQNNTSDYYTVIVSFTKLSGLKASVPLPGVVEVGPNVSKVAITLSKVGLGQPDFSYSYRYYKGCYDPEPDDEVAYALPISRDKKVKPRKINYIFSAMTEKENPENWNGVKFIMDPGDTIFATRRGMVQKVEDNSDLNRMIVFNGDCTYTKYENFKSGTILVKVNETVNVGDALGIVSEAKPQEVSGVYVLSYTFSVKDMLARGEEKLSSTYFPIKWMTEEGLIEDWDYTAEYTSKVTDEIIMQEMTKKERKRWLKNRE